MKRLFTMAFVAMVIASGLVFASPTAPALAQGGEVVYTGSAAISWNGRTGSSAAVSVTAPEGTECTWDLATNNDPYSGHPGNDVAALLDGSELGRVEDAEPEGPWSDSTSGTFTAGSVLTVKVVNDDHPNRSLAWSLDATVSYRCVEEPTPPPTTTTTTTLPPTPPVTPPPVEPPAPPVKPPSAFWVCYPANPERGAVLIEGTDVVPGGSLPLGAVSELDAVAAAAAAAEQCPIPAPPVAPPPAEQDHFCVFDVTGTDDDGNPIKDVSFISVPRGEVPTGYDFVSESHATLSAALADDDCETGAITAIGLNVASAGDFGGCSFVMGGVSEMLYRPTLDGNRWFPAKGALEATDDPCNDNPLTIAGHVTDVLAGVEDTVVVGQTALVFDNEGQIVRAFEVTAIHTAVERGSDLWRTIVRNAATVTTCSYEFADELGTTNTVFELTEKEVSFA